MSPDLVFGERRLHERKECTFSVQIDDYDTIYTGHMRNLSVGGAFIEPPGDSYPAVGQDVVLTIPYRNKKDRLIIKGRIARTRYDGMGVAFLTGSETL